MKMRLGILCVALTGIAVHSLRLAQQGTPVARVAGLLADLEARIESDGKSEQQSYDKYACWCESTLGRKANDIATAKDLLAQLETDMKKLSGEIAAHEAEIKQVKKDIAANMESQREATEVRDKAFQEYKEDKIESEQCIGALEAAIKVLTGAGTSAGKRAFLENIQEAQVLSVVDGIRGVLSKAPRSVPDQDLQVVKRFVDHPEEFMGSRGGALSAAQIANNPFGDYAPQSTQIQGILKGMYDTFTSSLEKANADEANEEKSFQELMATKQKELATLQVTLETHNLDKATKNQKLADSKQLFDDTQVQLAADEEFFANTKAACKEKAREWASRVRLRTEELHGIAKAIEILSSPEAQAIFENATTTFLQVSSRSDRNAVARREKAFTQLRSMAKKYRSLELADIASQVQDGGHFDEVIASIDRMIDILRKEEAMDIEHRDRCQGATNKNDNDMEDLDHTIDKSEKTINRLKNEQKEVETKISALHDDLQKANVDMATLFQMRQDEHQEFVQALKADADAIELLDMAVAALTKFYKKNKIPILVQKTSPEYTVDPDKAPETNWAGGRYEGRQSESQGLLAILGMIKEDLQKEMKVARQEEAEAQSDYKKDEAALDKVIKAHEASILALDKRLGELKGDEKDEGDHKREKEGDLETEKKLENALYNDCSWVDTHFETRRAKRKTEMDGLVDAKGYLAGVDSGDEVSP